MKPLRICVSDTVRIGYIQVFEPVEEMGRFFVETKSVLYNPLLDWVPGLARAPGIPTFYSPFYKTA